MKKLTERDVIQTFLEQWEQRISRLFSQNEISHLMEQIDIALGNNIVSPELKVKHKSSGLLYTIDSVGPRDIMLRNPEGKKFLVDADELESDYIIA